MHSMQPHLPISAWGRSCHSTWRKQNTCCKVGGCRWFLLRRPLNMSLNLSVGLESWLELESPCCLPQLTAEYYSQSLLDQDKHWLPVTINSLVTNLLKCGNSKMRKNLIPVPWMRNSWVLYCAEVLLSLRTSPPLLPIPSLWQNLCQVWSDG